jgi:hypothetical protein
MIITQPVPRNSVPGSQAVWQTRSLWLCTASRASGVGRSTWSAERATLRLCCFMTTPPTPDFSGPFHRRGLRGPRGFPCFQSWDSRLRSSVHSEETHPVPYEPASLVRATKYPMDTNEQIRKLAEEGGSVPSISRDLSISRRQVAIYEG